MIQPPFVIRDTTAAWGVRGVVPDIVRNVVNRANVLRLANATSFSLTW
jgi:hypothetical protein